MKDVSAMENEELVNRFEQASVNYGGSAAGSRDEIDADAHGEAAKAELLHRLSAPVQPGPRPTIPRCPKCGAGQDKLALDYRKPITPQDDTSGPFVYCEGCKTKTFTEMWRLWEIAAFFTVVAPSAPQVWADPSDQQMEAAKAHVRSTFPEFAGDELEALARSHIQFAASLEQIESLRRRVPAQEHSATRTMCSADIGKVGIAIGVEPATAPPEPINDDVDDRLEILYESEELEPVRKWRINFKLPDGAKIGLVNFYSAAQAMAQIRGMLLRATPATTQGTPEGTK